jgi:hypothetical protein
MDKFEPFVDTEFGTLTIHPVGDNCVRIFDGDDNRSIVLTFAEAEELRDILVEITVASRPAALVHWLCRCRTANPVSDLVCASCGADKPASALETAAVREFTTKLPKMGMSTVCDLCGETFGNHIAQHPDGRTSACPTVNRKVNS